MSSLTMSAPIVIGTSLANATANTLKSVTPVAPQVYAGASGFQAINSGSVAADTDTGANIPVAAQQLYAGTLTNNWRRPRGNENQTLLTSVGRTITTSSADFKNYNARGVMCFWNWTIAGATPSLIFTIEGKDPISGLYFALATAAAQTTIGARIVIMYPTVTGGSSPLSLTWRVTITHNNANSNTYSVSADLIV